VARRAIHRVLLDARSCALQHCYASNRLLGAAEVPSQTRSPTSDVRSPQATLAGRWQATRLVLDLDKKYCFAHFRWQIPIGWWWISPRSTSAADGVGTAGRG